MIASVGCRTPSLHTAMGKALLAYLHVDDSASDAAAADTVANRPSRAIYRELTLIRERGYAIDKEENEPGVGCIGVPILNAMGHPAAAMSVSGPVHRIFASEKEISAALMEACDRMSRALGYESRPRAIDRTATTRQTRGASVGKT
jgi:DNA-binding IclR family transcriptional regulator